MWRRTGFLQRLGEDHIFPDKATAHAIYARLDRAVCGLSGPDLLGVPAGQPASGRLETRVPDWGRAGGSRKRALESEAGTGLRNRAQQERCPPSRDPTEDCAGSITRRALPCPDRPPGLADRRRSRPVRLPPADCPHQHGDAVGVLEDHVQAVLGEQHRDARACRPIAASAASARGVHWWPCPPWVRPSARGSGAVRQRHGQLHALDVAIGQLPQVSGLAGHLCRSSSAIASSTAAQPARRQGWKTRRSRDSSAVARFSNTVMERNTAAVWNERPTPRRQMCAADRSTSSRPSRRTPSPCRAGPGRPAR